MNDGRYINYDTRYLSVAQKMSKSDEITVPVEDIQL